MVHPLQCQTRRHKQSSGYGFPKKPDETAAPVSILEISPLRGALATGQVALINHHILI